MIIDFNLALATQYVKEKIPFLVLKPDHNSIDSAIPYLAEILNMNLVKIGIHDLGKGVKEIDAFNFIKEIIPHNTNKTLFWVEDISGVDDKISLIHKTLELNKEAQIIFSGIKEHCLDVLPVLPWLAWDTRYPSKTTCWLGTYITPNKNQTIISCTQDLHFRVYVNIIQCLMSAFGKVPSIWIEIADGRVAPINSIILLATLAIKKNDCINIITNTVYSTHKKIIECINEGLNKKVLGQVMKVEYANNHRISSLG